MQKTIWKYALATALLAATALLGIAQAQVYRCTENGRTSYSNMPCARGVTREVNTTPNSIDRRLEREYHQRLIRPGNQRSTGDANIGDVGSSRSVGTGKQVNSMACKNARRDLDAALSSMQTDVSRGKGGFQYKPVVEMAQQKADSACGTVTASRTSKRQASPDTTAGDHDQHVAPPPAPGLITNCDRAGCWSTDGQRYNNAGGGNFYRGDGKFCTRAGNTVTCN